MFKVSDRPSEDPAVFSAMVAALASELKSRDTQIQRLRPECNQSTQAAIEPLYRTATGYIGNSENLSEIKGTGKLLHAKKFVGRQSTF